MEKLLFAIYKDGSQELKHLIVYRKNKKQIKEELREKGFLPKAVFSQKDIDAILSFEFLNSDVTDKEVDYLQEHLDEWEKSL